MTSMSRPLPSTRGMALNPRSSNLSSSSRDASSGADRNVRFMHRRTLWLVSPPSRRKRLTSPLVTTPTRRSGLVEDKGDLDTTRLEPIDGLENGLFVQQAHFLELWIQDMHDGTRSHRFPATCASRNGTTSANLAIVEVARRRGGWLGRFRSRRYSRLQPTPAATPATMSVSRSPTSTERLMSMSNSAAA